MVSRDGVNLQGLWGLHPVCHIWVLVRAQCPHLNEVDSTTCLAVVDHRDAYPELCRQLVCDRQWPLPVTRNVSVYPSGLQRIPNTL